MANALQFIESNIEDLEKDEVQKEIVKKFLTKIEAEKATYPQIGMLAKYYNEGSSDTANSLNIEELRLV